jgi:hypothetical protein
MNDPMPDQSPAPCPNAAVASQSEVNRAVRILGGRKLKYTCQILFKGGQSVEFQAQDGSSLTYDNDAREAILRCNWSDNGKVYVPWKEVLLYRQEGNE